MRKRIWITLIAIAALITTTQTYAYDLTGLIGKTVDNVRPLYIDDERASQDVLIIQGRSFLPVRSALTMFGYEVDYEDGKVLITSKNEPEPTPTPEPQQPKEEPSTYVPIYYGMTTLEMIDQEIEALKHLEGVFQQISDSLTQSMSYSNSANQQLQEYYTKLYEVRSELYYWETLREMYLKRPEL